MPAERDASREIAAALPWVHAAGQPYVDWLLGGRDAARRILEQWMRRPSSEVFIGRVVVADQTHSIGGYIALSGAELARCRMQDAVAAAALAPPNRSSELLARLRLGRELFSDVSPEDLYLSRMGVMPQARRHGYGKAIVREYLRQGTRRGFRRFALDVSASNDAAIELYRSVGFLPERRQHVRGLDMTYVRMATEVSYPAEPVSD